MLLGEVLKPTWLINALLVAGIVLGLVSILGVDVSVAGNRLIPLSATTDTFIDEDVTATIVEQPPKAEEPGYEIVRMRVTAYCPCKKCCGKFADGITACNHKIRRGDVFVAADKRYRFGTELIIPGYNNNKPVKVLDRGGAIKGNKLDVFFHSHRQARKWGVRYLDVKVKM